MSRVLVCGMYRSGTTFIHEMLKQVVSKVDANYELKKPHLGWGRRLKPLEDDILIYCYRDVRDIIVSYCQSRKFTYDSFKIHANNPQSLIYKLIDLDDRVRSHPTNKLTLRYETDIFGKELEVLNKITNLIGIDGRYNLEVSNNFKIEKIKKITDKIEKFKHSVSNWWPNHVTDGKSGKWKDYFTNELDWIENDDKVKSWLIKNNYE
tara:strand:+ start:261 stop:881 length:621 start_codon:yes stop_codon:yes gene_type:complete